MLFEDNEHILGTFSSREGRDILSCTWGIYQALMDDMFPQVGAVTGARPLTGFRAIRTSALTDLEHLPEGYGIESHLNIETGMRNPGGIRLLDIGWYEGRFAYKPYMGREIGEAIIDAGLRRGIITSTEADDRRAFVERVRQVIADYRGDDPETFLDRLQEVSGCRIPSV